MAPGPGSSPPPRRDPRRTALLVVVAVAAGLVVTATGSYGLGWEWTGFRGNKVWDWMHLLLVPIVLGAQPLWIRTRHLQVPWRAVVVPLLAGMGAFIALSYGFHWSWTGFEGKQLWDWLNLLVLPFAVPAAFIWIGFRLEEERQARPAEAGSADPSGG